MDTKEVLRWVLLIGATPIWLPFILTIWRDFNDALEEDGGLLGSPPTGTDLEEVLAKKAARPEVLVSEPIVRDVDRRPARMAATPRANAPASAPGRPRNVPGAGPRFR